MTNEQIFEICKEQSLVQWERLISVCDSIDYICQNRIPGDIVECGVWRGGCMMAAALSLLRNNVTDRTIYLFDTFEGMTAPTKEDYVLHNGEFAADILAREGIHTGTGGYAELEIVKQNMKRTGYPVEKIVFVKGDVLKTIPGVLPEVISFLRLDTDWYESTAHELTRLYPHLTAHGILTIDDYGHWAGSRKAVDEYFSREPLRPFFHRIDYTGILLQKF